MSRELQQLIADLGKLPADLKRELRPGMREAAKPALEQARSNASWSSRIPNATKITTSLVAAKAGVALRVDSGAAPHGRPYENQGVPGNFRHPVFPDPNKTRREWNWVAQRARPFLFRAVREKADEVVAKLDELVVKVARRNGWR